jgi:predicted amidohydrolase
MENIMKEKLQILVCTIIIFFLQSTTGFIYAQIQEESDNKTIIIQVNPINLPESSTIFITGNINKLGNWDPSKVSLIENPDKIWSIELQIPKNTHLEYKITRGSWEKEALRKDRSVPSNHLLVVKNDTTIVHEIQQWKDQIGQSFKIAHLQISAKINDIEFNRLKGEKYCRKADSLGADLALFPENYSNGMGSFNLDDPQEPEISLKQAITKEDKFIQHFISLAAELDMAIAITFFEKEDQNYYFSICVIDRFGKIRLTHRKVHLWEWGGGNPYTTPGHTFDVCELDTKNGNLKLGAMICADWYFPESARILMLNGAEIVIVPNAAPIFRDLLVMLKARAFENCMGIALTNYPHTEGTEYTGMSTAYNPNPWVNADTPWGKGDYSILEAGEEEGIFISEFDLEKIRQYRKETYFGNAFRHPGVYHILIDTTVNEPFRGRKTGLGDDFTREKRINFKDQ